LTSGIELQELVEVQGREFLGQGLALGLGQARPPRQDVSLAGFFQTIAKFFLHGCSASRLN
jgi:hypothetical protein